MSFRAIRLLNTLIILLALGVVMLGAYTRLTDAGLGCPDWPGCYGQLVLSTTQTDSGLPIELTKAWTEMAHRYAAGSLVLLIVLLIVCLARSTHRSRLTNRLSIFLLALLGFQAALGMWTVTLKLLPIVVMGHLLGGLLIFASLVYLRAAISSITAPQFTAWRWSIRIALLIIGLQIALGGWVSSNYAGIACIGFPQCNGQWLPHLDWTHAFNFFSSPTVNYQGGLLTNQARVTIQVIHRVGALITLVYLLTLSALLTRHTTTKRERLFALSLGILVIMQCSLGIANVVYFLPLWVAVLHNGCAALLLANGIVLHYLTRSAPAR